jgi:hypothetical protein
MIRPRSEKERAMEAFKMDMHAESVARKAGFKDAMHMRAVARRWMRPKEPVARPLMEHWGNQQ